MYTSTQTIPSDSGRTAPKTDFFDKSGCSNNRYKKLNWIGWAINNWATVPRDEKDLTRPVTLVSCCSYGHISVVTGVRLSIQSAVNRNMIPLLCERLRLHFKKVISIHWNVRTDILVRQLDTLAGKDSCILREKGTDPMFVGFQWNCSWRYIPAPELQVIGSFANDPALLIRLNGSGGFFSRLISAECWMVASIFFKKFLGWFLQKVDIVLKKGNLPFKIAGID
jgi:hypothetical protein